MIETAADRALFFADFGVIAEGGTVVLTTSGPIVTTPEILFFQAIYDIDPTTGDTDIDLDHPNAQGLTVDFAAARHKDTLVINGTTFKINRVLPDGTGFSNIWLDE